MASIPFRIRLYVFIESVLEKGRARWQKKINFMTTLKKTKPFGVTKRHT